MTPLPPVRFANGGSILSCYPEGQHGRQQRQDAGGVDATVYSLFTDAMAQPAMCENVIQP